MGSTLGTIIPTSVILLCAEVYCIVVVYMVVVYM